MVDLGKLGANGFRIHGGRKTWSFGGTDFNDDGFDDVVLRSDTLVYVIFGSGLEKSFLRGDCNADGVLDVTDPIANLSFQFIGTFDPPCRDALDFDDSGELDVTDPIANLTHQFVGGPPPAPPGKDTCGVDPTEDKLGCESFAACGENG